MDPTRLRRAVDRLYADQLGLDIWPTAWEPELRAAEDALNLDARIRVELDEIRAVMIDRIERHGGRAKLCEPCGRWFVDTSPTRPRLYCSQACKDDRRYSR